MTARSLLLLLAGGALALSALAACGSARRGAVVTGPHEPPTAEVALGQRVFDAHCNGCHPGGEAGLAPSLNDKPLPDLAVRFQVRNGLGAMPAFPHEVISDEELGALVAYLVWLRGLEPAEGALRADS